MADQKVLGPIRWSLVNQLTAMQVRHAKNAAFWGLSPYNRSATITNNGVKRNHPCFSVLQNRGNRSLGTPLMLCLAASTWTMTASPT